MSRPSTAPKSASRIKATPPVDPPLDPFTLTGAAFVGAGTLDPRCRAADLFMLAFDSIEADPDSILDQLLGSLSDDFDLIRAASLYCRDQTDASIELAIERVCYRATNRITVGREVARRINAAQQEGGRS